MRPLKGRNLLGTDIYRAGQRGGTARAACYALRQMGVGSLHVFNRSGEKAVALAADLASDAACRKLAEEVGAREQRVDVLVNNAGVTWGGTFEDFPEAAWARTMTACPPRCITVTPKGTRTTMLSTPPTTRAAAMLV